MTAPSIEMFKQYLKNQQDDFLHDGRRVELIIRGIFHEEKSLIPLLTSTWEAGIVTKLRQSANLEVTISQFGDRFCRENSLRESSALTAVRVWAYALGLTGIIPSISDDSKISSSGSQPRENIIAKTDHLTARADETILSTTTANSAKVRETSQDGRFIAYDNETVFDTGTGLMWAAEDNGDGVDWQTAKSYCENYRGGGYIDWRMPTPDELAGLHDASKTKKRGKYSEYISTDLISLSYIIVWTSETYRSDAVLFNFYINKRDWESQSITHSSIALPVRSADLNQETLVLKRPQVPSSNNFEIDNSKVKESDDNRLIVNVGEEPFPRSIPLLGNNLRKSYEDTTDRGMQNDEFIRQQEGLEREKEKLAREGQEIEKMSALAAKQKKPEAQHRELYEIDERKVAKINGMVVWNGMWFLVDTMTEVKLDKSLIGHGSVKKGFKIPFTTSTGTHQLTLKVPLRGEKTYSLIFDENGNYRVTVQFSRLLGNWGEACLTKI